MLRAIFNKSWRQHPTRHQLYGHLPSITKTIQVRRTRHAGHCWRNKDELISDVLLWTPAYGQVKAGNQLEHTYSSYVRIRDVALKTCERRWMIGRSGERGSGISVLAAWHDDDDDIYEAHTISFQTFFVWTFKIVPDYLTKMGIKTVPQLHYSRKLAACDFWLFPKLRGCCYETIGEMKEAVTKVIDTLT